MNITYVITKRPVKEKVWVRYFPSLLPNSKDIWVDSEIITRFPIGEKLFRVERPFGGSGARDIKYFKYVGEVMDYIKEEYPELYESMSYNQYQCLGVTLSNLITGEYNIKRVIVNNRGVRSVRGE